MRNEKKKNTKLSKIWNVRREYNVTLVKPTLYYVIMYKCFLY